MQATPNITRFEYRGVKVVIGKSPIYSLWRASLDGKEIRNAFFKSFAQADAHCKAIIDARHDEEGEVWNDETIQRDERPQGARWNLGQEAE